MTCPPKYACDSVGTDYPTKFCAAGYFCKSGSDTTTPNIGPHANECPLGKYCPEGKMIFFKPPALMHSFPDKLII